MMTGLPVLVSLLLGVGAACAIIWVVAETTRRMTLPGSQQRYVLAGVERALRYPAGAWLMVSAVCNFQYGLWPDMAVNVLGAATWGVVLVEKNHHGDDDDFWSDVAKRLKGLMSPRLAASGA